MLDALKSIVENSMLSEDTKNAINEAWENKVREIRESVETELRGEFAQRYEHDKGKIIEGLDRMVSENLQKELNEFAEDRKALISERVQYKKQTKEHAAKLQQFVLENLAKELKEFKAERDAFRKDVAKLESFVVKNLSKEIMEFAEDKKELVNAKVRLVAEAKSQLNAVKKQFVSRAAAAVETAVTEGLKTELSQLKEDIEVARKNNFGQRLFEAFSKEFASSHYSETAEIRKMRGKLLQAVSVMENLKKQADTAAQLVESKQKMINEMRDSSVRSEVMGGLLEPLGKKPRAIMEDLLRTVPTAKLRESFDKYLPSVLNEGTPSAPVKKALVESRKEVTGDKPVQNERPAAEIFDLRKLAGLSK